MEYSEIKTAAAMRLPELPKGRYLSYATLLARYIVPNAYFKRLMRPQTNFQHNWQGGSMAVAGSAQNSIYLELNGRKLFEGATMLRQNGVILDDAASAWRALTQVGRCYLRLYGANLPELRAMHAAWLAALKLEEVEE